MVTVAACAVAAGAAARRRRGRYTSAEEVMAVAVSFCLFCL
jgi:hypothetical protein